MELRAGEKVNEKQKQNRQGGERETEGEREGRIAAERVRVFKTRLQVYQGSQDTREKRHFRGTKCAVVVETYQAVR